MADSFNKLENELGLDDQLFNSDSNDGSDKLTKAHLAEVLSENMGLSYKLCSELVVSFFDEIKHALTQGQPVKIQGFGSFNLRDKPPRPGRNPKTGEPKEITARRVVTFKPSRSLREQINNRADSEE